ncbi:MAG: lytic transglycosylase domain-containing protein [Deltaproteobacteria bacterium]|nr:lytic transglycosylase domain-containing protein [Deltaproteobacteria bacterium]
MRKSNFGDYLPTELIRQLRPPVFLTVWQIVFSLRKPILGFVFVGVFGFSLVSEFFRNGSSYYSELNLAKAYGVNRPDFFMRNERYYASYDVRDFKRFGGYDREHLKKIAYISDLISSYGRRVTQSPHIAKHIVEQSTLRRVDPFYVAAIISVESSFLPRVRSKAGAMGLMQLLPNTAHEVSRQITGKRSYPVLTDPETNISLGIEYVKKLEEQYRGNRYMALAAYNWGPGNVDKVGKNVHSIPSSVRQYASKVLHRSLKWRNHYERVKHGIFAEVDEATT